MRTINLLFGSALAIAATAGLLGGGHPRGSRFPPARPAPPAFDTGDTGSGGVASPDAAGQLLITELMIDPSNTYDEWLEVQNLSGVTLDLDGCAVESPNGSGDPRSITISGSLEVAPGARLVLAMETETTGSRDCIDDPDDGCSAPVDYRYGATINFANKDPDSVTISCGGTVIDTVNFDLDLALGPTDCSPTSYPGGCALSLDPLITSAAENDDGTSIAGPWCLPEDSSTYANSRVEATLGTPGQPNTCAEVIVDPGDDTGPPTDDTATPHEDICGVGQAIFTEAMPSPKTDSNQEWLEIKGLTDTCSLHACRVISSTSDDPDDTDAWEYDVQLVETTAGQLQISQDQYMILSRGTKADAEAGISWTNTSDGTTVAANYIYAFGALYLKTDPRWLHLICEDEVVDSAPMDWSSFDSQISHCPDGEEDVAEGVLPGNCSMNLAPTAESETGNDNNDAWCVPEEDGNVWQRTDHDEVDTGVEVRVYELYSTLGRAGDCQTFVHPAVGDLIFTEVMPSPADTNEWFELYNPTGVSAELSLCSLVRYRIDELTGEETSIKEYVFGSDGSSPSVEPGTAAVFAYNGCILSDRAADTGDDTGDDTGTGPDDSTCAWNEQYYKTVSFTDGETEHLALRCSDSTGVVATVDEFSFNTTVQGVRKGHSLMYDPTDAADPATDNDSTSSWCEAGFEQNFCQPGDESCNYGTPGTIDTCKSSLVGPEGSWCKCGTTGAPAAIWTVGVGLLATLRRRRRAP